MFLNFMQIFYTYDYGKRIYEEMLIKSSSIDEYTLARHGNKFYMIPSKKLTGDDAYNTLPPQIIYEKGQVQDNLVFFNMVGKFMCTINDKLEGCLDKTNAYFHIIKDHDGMHYKIHSADKDLCVAVGSRDHKNNRYAVELEKCTGGLNEKFMFIPVTSKEEVHLKVIEKSI